METKPGNTCLRKRILRNTPKSCHPCPDGTRLSFDDKQKIQLLASNSGELLDFSETIRKISIARGEDLSSLVKEIQYEIPDLATEVVLDKNFFKLSFLIDNGWDQTLENSQRKTLLKVALQRGYLQNIDLLLRSGGWKLLMQERFDEFTESSSLRKYLLEWKLHPNSAFLVDGEPDFKNLRGAYVDSQVENKQARPQWQSQKEIPPDAFLKVDVPYATNRAANLSYDPTRIESVSHYFSYNRSASLNYGIAQVSIPKTHETGHLESPGFFEFRQNPSKHVVLMRLDVKDERSFFNEIKTRVQKQKERRTNQRAANDLFVFIHGFNTDFTYALRKSAQLIYDMNFPGTSLAFSWPARMVKIPLPGDFRNDVSRLQESIDVLETFLRKLKSEVPHRKIHIIAHSLGARLLTEVLTRIALDSNLNPNEKPFGEVILAAPAMDAKSFEEHWSKELLPICERVSLMASGNDIALKVEFLAEDNLFTFPLGLWNKNKIALAEGVSNYDLTALNSGLLSVDHSTYSEAPVAIDHMGLLINNQPTANELDALYYLNKTSQEDFFSAEIRSFWKFLAI